jgi:hypothetical protein
MQLLLQGARIRHLPINGYTWNIHAQDSKSLKLIKDPLFYQGYRDLFTLAQKEKFISHIAGGNPYIAPEDVTYANNLASETT